jgi:hypothetical protein
MKRRQLWTESHSQALEEMVERRLITSPPHPLRMLKHIASVGYAYQCGRIFYPTTAGEARAAFGRELRKAPQMRLFA